MIFRSAARVAAFLCLIGAVAAQADEIPLADGKSWMESTNVEKTAYIVGASNMLVVEYITQQKSGNPPTKEQSSVPGFWDNTEGVSIDQLIAAIDRFYKDNPGSMETPVLVVIWNTYVEPGE